MTEVWKDIAGHEGCYQASSEGRIRSLDRSIPYQHRNGNWYTRNRVGQILTTHNKVTNSGYEQVALGRIPSRCVHEYVAETFLPPKPNPNDDVNHINGIKLDNRAVNLEWMTRAQNIQHALNMGFMNIHRGKGKGVSHFNATLLEQEVREIKSNINNLTNTELADKYGTTPANISHILDGRSWKHV
jgi:hypothetical protein